LGKVHGRSQEIFGGRGEFAYLFLSSEKGFAAFCRILTETQKPIYTIGSVAHPVFSMVS
jgi:hypothetical protein